MSNLLIGLLGALVSTNQPEAVSNLVQQTTGVSIVVPDPNDPVEKEFKRLMEDDDAAQAEIDNWIQDNEKFVAKGAGVDPGEMRQKILRRLEKVRKGYEDFLKRHPEHARARVAFASLLTDLHDEEGSQEQLEKALETEKKDPAIYNNLANHYGHTGPVKKAFEFYAKAIELDPTESVYYHNFGTTVYLFRKDAKEFYNINEQEVFDKALTLYSNAMKFDPTNFPLASDVAQTYYGIRPTRTEDALKSWTNALSVAHDEIEREGVYAHFARIKMNAGRFDEARGHLNAITNSMYGDLKARLERNLKEKQAKAAATNAASEEVPGAAANDPPKAQKD